MGNYDAIIVGAGHNGLVAAAYLAKAGRKVLVLERSGQVGGAAVTEEIFPGFKVSTVADGGGYLSAKVRRDLRLDSKVEWIESEAVVFSPQPDGEQLTIWRDSAKTIAEIARFSRKDAAAYPEFLDLMTALAGVVGGLMEIVPPDLPDVSFSDIRRNLSMLGPLRRLGRKRIPELARVLPMSVVDLMDEFFESPAVKGAIGASSILGVSYGPMESGTVLAMLSNWAQSGTGLFRSASVVRGGIGALTAAMAESARDFGAEIRTGAAVARITVEGQRTTGVVLDSGEHFSAPVVASATDVTSTFFNLVGPRSLDARFVRHVRSIKYRGSATRIHLALSSLPKFTSLASNDAVPLSGPIQISPSLEYVQKAYDPTKYGRYATAPYLDLLIPTLSDPGLAPESQHLLSMTVKFAPFELRDGNWNEHQDALADIAIDTLAEYAPGLQDLILSRHVISLADLQSDYGLVEGSPSHGDMTLDHFMHMRPIPGYARYRTPIEGLYLCSAASHPGGGVTGIPGSNAAQEILRDTD